MKNEIRVLAGRYADELKRNIDKRVADMEQDDRSHVLIYEVLGVTKEEGKLIDVYQNKGRFLYKYAGSLLEEAAKLCFKAKFPSSGSIRIPNTRGKKPKLFGVDCLVGKDALEIKWRDATTDGDHITKEHTRAGGARCRLQTGTGYVLLPESRPSHPHPESIGKPLHGCARRVSLRRGSMGVREATHGRELAQ